MTSKEKNKKADIYKEYNLDFYKLWGIQKNNKK